MAESDRHGRNQAGVGVDVYSGNTRIPGTHAIAALLCIMTFVYCRAPLALAAEVSSYPVRPIRMIVTFAPGSGADVVARLLGQRLSESLGQQVVIDNRAGAGGNIGTELAAKAAQDGYTVVVCATALVIGPSLYENLPYDPMKDFQPVTLLVSLPFLLVANPSVAAKNVRELVQLASSRPAELSYASIGAGTMQHIAAELFKSMAHVDLVHVPYKATGQYVTDLISGRVSVMFSGMPPMLPHVRSGKLRALAVTTLARSSALPDVPTIAESGVAGYEANVWFGLLAPARTAEFALRKLHQHTVDALRSPRIHEQLVLQGAEPVGNTPQEFATIMAADRAKYARIIKDANIRLQ